MRKYRIKETTNHKGDSKFIPQVRHWILFIPIWVGFVSGMCRTDLYYTNLREAIEFVRSKKEKTVKSRIIHKV